MSRKVIQQFGGWSVTKAGSVFHKQMQYWIYDNRVNERDWEEHISKKNWGEVENFRKALKLAREIVAKKK